MGLETSTIIALVSAGISAGIGTYTAVDQAQTAKETAKYNNEALGAEARNKDALAAEAVRRERQQNRRKIADLRNTLAQNGTLSTEGTPLAIIGESSANLELGIQDAARAASEQSNGLRAQGAMSLWEGDQQASAGYVKAGASALSGLSGVAKDYYDAGQQVPAKAKSNGSNSSNSGTVTGANLYP